MIKAILLVAALLPTQGPKTEGSVLGRWMLKSATVDGKAAKAGEMSGFLKKAGGIDAEMIYTFAKPNSEKETLCHLNDVMAGYSYDLETRKLYVESGQKDHEFEHTFDVTFKGKDMELRFKEKDQAKPKDKEKVVKLLFSRD